MNITVEHLTHIYGEGTPFSSVALDDISFALPEGRISGLVGCTGSGKSTLVQHLNGLLRPSSGRVLLDGQDLWGKDVDRRKLRFSVGLVFQYPEYQLFEETVAKDIAFGPKNAGLSDAEIEERVRWALSFVQLPEEVLSASPFDLSGGQKRKVAIAGVIAMAPSVLILDEPTAGLDPGGRARMLESIESYRAETGATVLLISHNMNDVATVCEFLLVLHDGRLLLSGAPADLFQNEAALTAIGLSVPDMVAIFHRLAARGYPADPSLLTPAAAAEWLLAQKGAGTC